MDMQCASCGVALDPQTVTCSQCNGKVNCGETTCECDCGNSFGVEEAKCDRCLNA